MYKPDFREWGWNDKYMGGVSCQPEWFSARVIAQERGLYDIISENGPEKAGVSGKFRYETKRISDYPAVGDFVLCEPNENGQAVIHRVLPRKSVFIRKAAGTSNQEQVVAANVDTVFLCMALNKDFNLRRMERYISIAWDSDAIPVIILTKCDLCEDVRSRKREVEEIAAGIDIIIMSSMETDGYVSILPYLKEGKTAALLGSSGVGKSTLINRLLGEDILATNGLRNDEENAWNEDNESYLEVKEKKFKEIARINKNRKNKR